MKCYVKKVFLKISLRHKYFPVNISKFLRPSFFQNVPAKGCLCISTRAMFSIFARLGALGKLKIELKKTLFKKCNDFFQYRVLLESEWKILFLLKHEKCEFHWLPQLMFTNIKVSCFHYGSVCCRSSHLEAFYKKRVLKNFVKFTEKHLGRSLVLYKVTYIPGTLLRSNLVKFLRTPFPYNTSGAASVVKLACLQTLNINFHKK